jgi:hypothetical protein
MAVYAGIDEAGYGPLLGPLCVACCVFEFDHEPADPPSWDLWKRLSRWVCRKPGDKRRRIAIDDSKKLKGPNDGALHPLKHLERGVLAFACLADELPASDDDLYRTLGAALDCDARSPWLSGPQTLPVAHEPGEVCVAAATLRRGLASAGVKSVRLQCRAIDPAEFNRQFDLMGNKAGINFCTAMRLVDELFRTHDGATLVIDRHGGRTHYREPLQMCFPESSITVVGESDERSEYELSERGRSITIRFEMESESRNLPTALASMTAKYVRELAMGRLNRYFRGHLPELKPTAGYVQDGRRFVAEIEGVVNRLGLESSRLIRKA